MKKYLNLSNFALVALLTSSCNYSSYNYANRLNMLQEDESSSDTSINDDPVAFTDECSKLSEQMVALGKAIVRKEFDTVINFLADNHLNLDYPTYDLSIEDDEGIHAFLLADIRIDSERMIAILKDHLDESYDKQSRQGCMLYSKKTGVSFLMLYAQFGDLDKVKQILNRENINIEQKDTNNETVLQRAVLAIGSRPNYIAMVELLLKNGAKIPKKLYEDLDDDTGNYERDLEIKEVIKLLNKYSKRKAPSIRTMLKKRYQKAIKMKEARKKRKMIGVRKRKKCKKLEL